MKSKVPKIGVGYTVGKLTVKERTPDKKSGYSVWCCECECGEKIYLDTRKLQRRTVRDCGCETRVKPGQKDLTGIRFGRLVCLEPTDERGKSGGTVWLCKCDCSNTCLAVSTQLTNGYKKSCGCWGHPPLKDFVGKRFHKLEVIDYAGKRAGMHRWLCRCDCGNETVVGQTLLQTGKTKSCGCLGHPAVKDIAGKKYGKLTTVSYEGTKNGQYMWRCVCECGKEVVVRQHNLIAGRTKSCGCLQATTIIDTLQLSQGTSVTILESSKRKLLSSNTSGHTGVYQNKKSGKWHAQITFKNKTYYLGTYTDKDDAIKARQRAQEMHDNFLQEFYSRKKNGADE